MSQDFYQLYHSPNLQTQFHRKEEVQLHGMHEDILSEDEPADPHEAALGHQGPHLRDLRRRLLLPEGTVEVIIMFATDRKRVVL